MAPHVGLYARISSDPEGDRLGVDRQIADCERLAASRGWVVLDRYVDDDRSAWSGAARPEYERMLEDLAEHRLDGVVVWDLDRLHRNNAQLERFIELVEQAGAKCLATVSGDVDLATKDGRLLARIMGAVAQQSSDKTSKRLRRKAQELAENGKVGGGGTRPFGFNDDRRTVREDEAALIREAAERILAGDNLTAICRDFEQRGVPTVTGASWRTITLKRMLTSARISGQREHYGVIVATAEWPAIITPEQTARLRAALVAGSDAPARTPRRYLLAGGLLTCSLCGAKLVSRPRDDGRRRYVCAKGPNFKGCGKIAAMADDLEELVTEAVLMRLDGPELQASLDDRITETATDLTAVRAELDALRDRERQLAQDWAAGELSRTAWKAAQGKLSELIAANEALLARRTQTGPITEWVGNTDQLRQAWGGLNLSRQRAIIATVLDHVEVAPAVKGRNRFDPDRFTPVWKL